MLIRQGYRMSTGAVDRWGGEAGMLLGCFTQHPLGAVAPLLHKPTASHCTTPHRNPPHTPILLLSRGTPAVCLSSLLKQFV